MKPTKQKPYACRNCRRVLQWVEAVGWLHTELPQYAAEPITCERPLPGCIYSNCDHSDGPEPSCACCCHVSGVRPVMDCSRHKGHRRWRGGIKDGHIDHLVHAAPSDYPERWGSMLSNGTRSWYAIDHEASKGKEVVYRFVGLGRDFADARNGDSRG